MQSPGKNNSLTDIEGFLVGNYTDQDAVSGVTAIICPNGATAGVDVRGSAPGTRETDLLAPQNLVEKVQSVVLSGGSVFGLSASDGVVRWLAEKGYGFPLENGYVAPIVPAAVLYDLGRGRYFIPPVDTSWGKKACESAVPGPVETGSVGAGTGAVSGGIKGGLGSASLLCSSGITVAAIVAVNSAGSVINPATGRPWEIGLELNHEFGAQGRRAVRISSFHHTGPVRNTTIGVVATDAALAKAQCQKIAQMAHDGMARAIRPAHTMFDGDTVFCLATGEKNLPHENGFFAAPLAQSINEIGHGAADCLARAVIGAVLNATSLAEITAFCDLGDF